MAVGAKKDIMEDEPLLEMSVKTSEEFTHLDEAQKMQVFHKILLKVKNVTSTDVIGVFREENTSRGSKNKETQLALRQGLDSKSAAAKKKFKKSKPSG